MSLFEDNRYQYRDTFFVFFETANRPSLAAVESSLKELGARYETTRRSEKNGQFESLTFVSPYDFSAMDVVLVQGEEVRSQIRELMDDFKTITLAGDEHKKLAKLGKCNARFDIFHFEQVSGGKEDEFLDPGGLLLVMQKLTEICDGIALDPQSQSLM